MSMRAIVAAREFSEARPTARLVLFVLASHADRNTDVAYPSVATLGHETGLVRRTVQDCLNELVAAGEIEQVGPRNGGRGRTTRYRIAVGAKGASSAPFDPRETAQAPAQTAQRGAHNSAPRAPERVGKGMESARARGVGRGAAGRERQPHPRPENVVELRPAAAAYAGPARCARCGVLERLDQQLCDKCYVDWAESGGPHPAKAGRR